MYYTQWSQTYSWTHIWIVSFHSTYILTEKNIWNILISTLHWQSTSLSLWFNQKKITPMCYAQQCYCCCYYSQWMLYVCTLTSNLCAYYLKGETTNVKPCTYTLCINHLPINNGYIKWHSIKYRIHLNYEFWTWWKDTNDQTWMYILWG